MRKKHINLQEARNLSQWFCEDFEIPYCEVYFVDRLTGFWGLYIWLNPNHMLVLKRNPCMIGLVMHELTHHLHHNLYTDSILSNPHSGGYQLAKNRVIKWCNKNLSTKPDWKIVLNGKSSDESWIKFQL